MSDGVPLEDNVEMSNLEQQLVKERNLTSVCKRRIAKIRQELDKLELCCLFLTDHNIIVVSAVATQAQWKRQDTTG